MVEGFLYHGSCLGIDGDHLEPRPKTGNIGGEFPEGEKDLVFATDNKKLAMAYAFKNKDMALCGEDKTGIIVNLYFTNERNLMEWGSDMANKRTEIYYISKLGFERNTYPNGKVSSEWQSDRCAPILNREGMSISDMMMNEVQFLFLNNKIHRENFYPFMESIAKDSLTDFFELIHIMKEEKLAFSLNEISNKGYVGGSHLENSSMTRELVKNFKEEVGILEEKFSKKYSYLQGVDNIDSISTRSFSK